MKNRSSYSKSAYGQMRDRIKEREEEKRKQIKVPYKYLLFTYGK